MAAVMRAAALCASALAAVIVVPAAAQTTPPAPAESHSGVPYADDGGQVADIVVVAQKREESIQSVPIAITAVSGEALRARFATDVASLRGVIPNVSLAPEGISAFASSFFIRGLGVDERESFSDPAVAVVVDDVTEARASVALTDLLDIASIEVLRGPQGTLQGRNASAGAILVRHNAPNLSDFGGDASIQIANYGTVRATGVINTPLVTDMLGLRVAALYSRSDGFYRNAYSGRQIGKTRHFVLLPSLRLNSGDLDVVLRGEYTRIRDDASTLLPYNRCGVDPLTVGPGGSGGANQQFVDRIAAQFGNARAARTCARPVGPDSFNVDQDRPYGEINDLDVYGITGNVNYDIESAGTLTYVGNYRHTREHSVLDPDSSPANLFASNDTTTHYQTSHEVRFASDFSDTVDFVAGALFLKQRYDLDRTQALGFAGALFTGGASQSNTQYGVFAQGNIHFTPQLSGVLGIRRTWDEKTMDICPVAPGGCGTRSSRLNDSWRNLSPRVGVNYKPNERVLLYGYWARGFRAGGFNGNAGTPETAGPYNQERVDTYELGFKIDALDRRLRINGDVFSIDASDLQRSITRISPSGSVDVITQNAAGARFRGAELEITAVPVRGLTLAGSIGYLDAKYTDYCQDLNGTGANDPSLQPCAPAVVTPAGTVQPVDLTGLPLNRAPRWNWRAFAGYEFPVATLADTALRPGVSVEWTHEGRQLTTQAGYPVGTDLGITNFDGFTVSPYRQPVDTVNANLWIAEVDDRFKVTAFVKNLLNDIAITRLSVVEPLWNFVTLTAPRTYGVELRLTF